MLRGVRLKTLGMFRAKMFALKEEITFVIHSFYVDCSKIHKVEHETTRRTFVFVH